MDASLSLLNLAGAIALLLWGVHMVQSGVQRAFGSDLRRFLTRALSSRIKAAAAGLGVTAVLQSSTATGLMVASFASGGFVALVPALAVMLGANVGTTLIVQALSFDVSRLSPVLLLAGVAMFRAGGTRTRDVGRVAIGLGLMLIALSQLLEIVTPYEDVPSLRILMGGAKAAPILALQPTAYERLVILFDGADEEARAGARAQWSELKAAGFTPSYWRQGDTGAWEPGR